MQRTSFFGLLMWGLATTVFGADIFVSPAGNDTQDGSSQATALATIAKARDKADALKVSGPVNVYLLPGTYYLKEPLVFGAANSGSASAPIIYKGQGKAIISGGIRVDAASTWAASSGSIMKTTIATGLKVDQLFLNGKRQIMARYPNYNESQMLQGYAADALTKAGAAANPAEGPGYIRALHGSMWGGNSYIITGKSGSSVSTAWVGDNNRGSGMHATYRMVENIYELLDAAGEWYYKKSTGDLFFWPPAGTDLNAATVELSSLTELLRFVGTANSSEGSVKYIQFENVSLTHTYRSLFDGTGDFFEKVTKSDWGIVRKGTVFMQNAENITIKNCLFDQIGGNGVFFSGYNRGHKIINNDFEDAGASCVCLFGLRSSIRCPNSWSSTPSCSDRTPGPATNEYPSQIKIENNYMYNLGKFEKQTSGVTGSATEFDTIRHNTIDYMPRAGINFCDGCWGGHLIEFNWVNRCVRESGDHGPFNAWGRDRNEKFGSGDLLATKLDARNTTVIQYNRFEGEPGNFGIDLDDQASNYYQIYNLLIGGGHKLQWNRNNTYLNNVIVRGGNVQFHGVWSSSNHYGARNIISSGESCLYQLLSGDTPKSTKDAIAQWDSNVVHYSKGTPNIATWNQCNAQIATWAQWTGAGLDVHSSTADPMFIDTQKVWRADYKPRGDFNVKAGSPALALGFKSFPMDSFGIMGAVGPDFTTVATESFRHMGTAPVGTTLSVGYNNRNLTIAADGEFQGAVVSAAGRTLSRFRGKGQSTFALEAKRIGCGVYFVVVRSRCGTTNHRFIVSRQ
jgi:hypothetical protein